MGVTAPARGQVCSSRKWKWLGDLGFCIVRVLERGNVAGRVCVCRGGARGEGHSGAVLNPGRRHAEKKRAAAQRLLSRHVQKYSVAFVI